MKAVQLDLFDMFAADEPEPVTPKAGMPVLNGFYYESNTGLYVSYCLGRRHFQTDGVGFPPEWRKMLKERRAI